MRALVMMGDSATAQSVALMMKSDGWIVETTDMGDEGVDLAKRYDYDLILLGDQLLDLLGRHALMRLRASVKTPVIVLSADIDLQAKLSMFREGADDYMVLPVFRDELTMRALAIVRRSQGHAKSEVQVGKVEVNLAEKIVRIGGRPVPLTSREYQILELLVMRRGTTLTKEMFMNHLYGGMDEPELKIIDVFICKLRRKLTNMGAGRIIETVRGRGYRVEKPATDAALA